jgi:hypothetical protein
MLAVTSMPPRQQASFPGEVRVCFPRSWAPACPELKWAAQVAALTQPRLQQALRALSPATAQSYASLAAPPEGAARAELRAHPARQLHARF